MHENHWTGKTAVLCGASAGLGKVLAAELCRQKVAILILIARREVPLQELRDHLQNEYPETEIRIICCDVSREAEFEQAAAKLATEAIKLDLVIQAVGQSDRGAVTELTDAKLEELFRVNVLPSLHVVRFLTPIMRTPGACIVFVGSLACHFAPRFLGGYAVAKHALGGLAQQCRLELREKGIHVMLASPGPIARADAGTRYDNVALDRTLPESALQPGGGAKIKGLSPQKLSVEILSAAAKQKSFLLRPRKAKLLLILSAISTRLGDRILRKKTS